MNNLCMGGGGQFVSRDEVALVQTPRGTSSWKPVPHIEVIDGGELRSDQGFPVLEAGGFCILRQKNYLMNFFHLFHLFSSISHSQ